MPNYDVCIIGVLVRRSKSPQPLEFLRKNLRKNISCYAHYYLYRHTRDKKDLVVVPSYSKDENRQRVTIATPLSRSIIASIIWRAFAVTLIICWIKLTTEKQVHHKSLLGVDCEQTVQ